MSRSFVYLMVSIFTAHLWHSACHAQLVRVAPGYVKAPFVRVYSYPDGSSYVRAPFVSVFSPGYRRGYGVPSGPTSSELAEMDWRLLGQATRASAAQLDVDLKQIPSGATWRSRLKIAELTALLPPESDLSPTDDVRQQLQEISRIYGGLDSSRESRSVSNLRSFQVLQQALAEYVTPPVQRLRRQLYFKAGQLNRALERFATGAGWQNYLMLSTGLSLSTDHAQSSESLHSVADYKEVLARFDSVGQNPDYRVISDLPEFKTTRQRLADYLGQLETPPAQKPEELPAPDSNAAHQAAES